MSSTPALSAPSAGAPFDTTTIQRRALGEHDVLIDIAFCGICHSDIHQVKDEWGGSIFPMVPGHEIAGVVAAVGGAVEK
ncbi:MAG: zinc-binding dehydrogenase, partial [Solirubrobacterales bacterium]|nr:zinc-binding dehydrogenase [Solirubrobacterales bacterium]